MKKLLFVDNIPGVNLNSNAAWMIVGYLTAKELKDFEEKFKWELENITIIQTQKVKKIVDLYMTDSYLNPKSKVEKEEIINEMYLEEPSELCNEASYKVTIFSYNHLEFDSIVRPAFENGVLTDWIDKFYIVKKNINEKSQYIAYLDEKAISIFMRDYYECGVLEQSNLKFQKLLTFGKDDTNCIGYADESLEGGLEYIEDMDERAKHGKTKVTITMFSSQAEKFFLESLNGGVLKNFKDHFQLHTGK